MLGDGVRIAGTAPADEDVVIRSRIDVDVPDIDRAPDECFDAPQPLQHLAGPGRKAVRDDRLAALSCRHQRLAGQRRVAVVHAQIDDRAQQIDGLRAVEVAQQVAIMGEQDAHRVCPPAIGIPRACHEQTSHCQHY